jgi:hypothetical protein
VVEQYEREFGEASALDKRCLIAILAQGQQGENASPSSHIRLSPRLCGSGLELTWGRVRLFDAAGEAARLTKNDFVLFLSRFGPLRLCVKKVLSSPAMQHIAFFWLTCIEATWPRAPHVTHPCGQLDRCEACSTRAVCGFTGMETETNACGFSTTCPRTTRCPASR